MSKKGTTQKKYQITSSPYEKIKSPFQNTQKKRSYPKEFIYFNRNQKMRNLVFTDPTTLADVESTIEAEDALDIYQQVMAEAAKCIQSCFRNSRYFTEVRQPPVVENNTISLDLSKSSNQNPETYEQAKSETDKQLSSNNEVESPHEDSNESQHEENQYYTENENMEEEENVVEDQIEGNYEEDQNEEEDEAQLDEEENIPNSNNENPSEEENQSNVNRSSEVETSEKNEEETEANEISNNSDHNSNNEEETQAEVDNEN